MGLCAGPTHKQHAQLPSAEVAFLKPRFAGSVRQGFQVTPGMYTSQNAQVIQHSSTLNPESSRALLRAVVEP